MTSHRLPPATPCRDAADGESPQVVARKALLGPRRSIPTWPAARAIGGLASARQLEGCELYHIVWAAKIELAAGLPKEAVSSLSGPRRRGWRRRLRGGHGELQGAPCHREGQLRQGEQFRQFRRRALPSPLAARSRRALRPDTAPPVLSQVYVVRHIGENKHYVMKVIKMRGIPKAER